MRIVKGFYNLRSGGKGRLYIQRPQDHQGLPGHEIVDRHVFPHSKQGWAAGGYELFCNTIWGHSSNGNDHFKFKSEVTDKVKTAIPAVDDLKYFLWGFFVGNFLHYTNRQLWRICRFLSRNHRCCFLDTFNMNARLCERQLQRSHGWCIVSPPGNQAANWEDKHQSIVSGKTGLLKSKYLNIYKVFPVYADTNIQTLYRINVLLWVHCKYQWKLICQNRSIPHKRWNDCSRSTKSPFTAEIGRASCRERV